MNREPYTMKALAAIRHEELLREAEHARLMRHIRSGQAGLLRRVCATVLIASGAKLTRMGQHLRPSQQATLLAVHAKRR